MKRVLIITILLATIGVASKAEHCYTRTGKVLSIENGIARIEDTTGNRWTVEGIELTEGQQVKLKMHDNYTINNIKDDIIKEVR